MSVELKSGERIAALKQGIEGVTGETYADLTEAVSGLKEKQYEAGKKAEYDAFWDAYQNKGTRTDYACGFGGLGWTDNTCKPVYDINPTTAYMMFRSCVIKDMRNIPVKINFAKSTNFQYTFQWASTEYITEIDTRGANGSFTYMFAYAKQLKTIEKLILRDDGSQNLAGFSFDSDDQLTNLTIEGKIGRNGMNVQWCNKITHESLMSIINALADKSADTSGTVWKVTIGETNRAKLTAEELEIAEQKGWVLD